MKPTSTTAMPDISDDAPHLTQADFERANFKVAGKLASKPEWQTAERAADDGFSPLFGECQVT
jgi:hypothetical protein